MKKYFIFLIITFFAIYAKANELSNLRTTIKVNGHEHVLPDSVSNDIARQYIEKKKEISKKIADGLSNNTFRNVKVYLGEKATKVNFKGSSGFCVDLIPLRVNV
jgi:hypothetical protein